MPIMLKAITPKKLQLKGIKQKIQKHIKPYAEGVDRDFRKTYETWSAESKPQQTLEVNINDNGSVSVTVDVIGDIYQMVHDGTPPHVIKPKRAKRLKFQTGYNSKTVIGQIRSQAGGPTGETVYSTGVNHPGFEGRNFSQLIMPKWRKPFYEAIDRAISEWCKEYNRK